MVLPIFPTGGGEEDGSDRSERSDCPANRSFLFVYYGKAEYHAFPSEAQFSPTLMRYRVA